MNPLRIDHFWTLYIIYQILILCQQLKTPIIKNVKMCIYVEPHHRRNSSIITSIQAKKLANQRQIVKKVKYICTVLDQGNQRKLMKLSAMPKP